MLSWVTDCKRSTKPLWCPVCKSRMYRYTVALQHLLAGVYIAELALIGLFGLGRATGPVVMVVTLFFATILYNAMVNRYLMPLEKHLPADLASRQAAGDESTPLLASAEEGRVRNQPPSHIQRLGQQARVPPRVVNPVARFFEPHVFASYHAMMGWLREDEADFRDHEEDAPHYSEDQLKNAYLSPALTSSTQIVWLPRDKTSASKNEVSENEKSGLKASDQAVMVKVSNVVNRNLVWFMLAVATGRGALSVGWRITSDNIKKYS